jgi:plasmid stabilization system protein ParE
MAALKLRLTLAASRRLDEILGFIAQDNPAAADKLAETVEAALERVAVFPASGRRIPEAPERPEREVVVPPCVRIFYRVESKILWVLFAMRSEQEFHAETLDT